jgi:hypothetical protein
MESSSLPCVCPVSKLETDVHCLTVPFGIPVSQELRAMEGTLDGADAETGASFMRA